VARYTVNYREVVVKRRLSRVQLGKSHKLSTSYTLLGDVFLYFLIFPSSSAMTHYISLDTVITRLHL